MTLWHSTIASSLSISPPIFLIFRLSHFTFRVHRLQRELMLREHGIVRDDARVSE